MGVKDEGEGGGVGDRRQVNQTKLTPATGDGTASTSVGVGLSTRTAVVVGLTAAGARHAVPLKSTVADVSSRC